VGGSGVIVCRFCCECASVLVCRRFYFSFENAETFDVSGGTSFSSATLMELLDLSDLSGTIIISSVVESLRHVVINIFNNHSRTQRQRISRIKQHGVGAGLCREI
jgi:hypothetical protein